MTKKRLSGLDELMIVNPGIPHTGNDSTVSQLYLGEDGTIYRLMGLRNETPPNELAEFYLGEDGTLYQQENAGTSNTPYPEESVYNKSPIGQYFLGEDGTIYRMVTL